MRGLAWNKGDLLDMTDDKNRAVVMHLQKDSKMRECFRDMGVVDAAALQQHGFDQGTKYLLNSVQIGRILQVGAPAHQSTL